MESERTQNLRRVSTPKFSKLLPYNNRSDSILQKSKQDRTLEIASTIGFSP